MWWKIYFLLIALLTVGAIIGIYGTLRDMNLADWIVITANILAVLGLYSFVYKKAIGNATSWKIVFWFFVIDFLFNLIISSTPLKDSIKIPSFLVPHSKYETQYAISSIISSLFTLPIFYSLFRLGYKQKSK